jgi:hypothetical protein
MTLFLKQSMWFASGMYKCRNNVILDTENPKVYKQPSSEEQPIIVQYSDSEKFFDNALEKSLTNESR